MNFAGRSVLVTGGTGFIGGRLVEKLVLEQRAHVRVLVRNFVHAARVTRFPVEIVAGDIIDREAVHKAVRGCDIVFHCAYDFAGERLTQRQAGVDGTRYVSEAVLQEGIRRMVCVSTFAVYAPMQAGDLTESSPWPRSNNAYACIKRAAERLVLDLHQQQGLPVVVIQPTLVYGPFSPHWTIAPINNLKTGVIPLVNGGAGFCNAVYIDDVVDAMILAAAQPAILGETFLISAEEPVTWQAFYNAFEAVLGIHATADISEAELRAAVQKRRRRAGTLAQLRHLAHDPQVIAQLLALPLAQRPLKMLRTHLSEARWQSLKSRVFSSDSDDQGSQGRAVQPIHLPDEALLGLYTSQSRVCIDKAKKRLGYLPQFDFKHGMEVTTAFLHWANLTSAPL